MSRSPGLTESPDSLPTLKFQCEAGKRDSTNPNLSSPSICKRRSVQPRPRSRRSFQAVVVEIILRSYFSEIVGLYPAFFAQALPINRLLRQSEQSRPRRCPSQIRRYRRPRNLKCAYSTCHWFTPSWTPAMRNLPVVLLPLPGLVFMPLTDVQTLRHLR